jgi:hypothetical protein
MREISFPFFFLRRFIAALILLVGRKSRARFKRTAVFSHAARSSPTRNKKSST